MFECTFDRNEKLIAVLQALAPFKDVTLTLTPHAIKCRQLTREGIILVDMHLASELFSHFRCDHPDEKEIAFDAEVLLKTCRTHSNERVVSLSWNDTERNMLSVRFDDLSSSGGFDDVMDADGTNSKNAAEIQIPLVVPQRDEMEIPVRTYDVAVDITTKLYTEIVDRFSRVGMECFDIIVNSQEMEWVGELSGGLKLREFFKNHTTVSWQWNSATGIDQLKARFSVRPLSLFCKCKDLSEIISIRVSHMTPMCVSYDLGQNSAVSYYLAPKTDDADE